MKKYISFFSLIVGLMLSISGCKPEDFWYGEYLRNSEIYYPGRVDSLSILPGNQRALLRFRVTTDPKITALKVYLRSSLSANQTASSYTIATGEYGQIKTIEINNLAEATYTANVYSFTADGDSSRAVTASQFIYGRSYINTLTNRPFLSINRTDPAEHFVIFAREPNLPREGLFYPMQFTEITFTNVQGGTTTVTTTPYNEYVSIKGVAPATIIRYRTAYKPTNSSIDLFYTDYDEILYE